MSTVHISEEMMQQIRDGKPFKIGILIDGKWHEWQYVGVRKSEVT